MSRILKYSEMEYLDLHEEPKTFDSKGKIMEARVGIEPALTELQSAT